MDEKKRGMILQLFAGEGGSAGGDGGAAASPDAGGLEAVGDKEQRRRSGQVDLSGVQYGVPSDAYAQQPVSQSQAPDDGAAQHEPARKSFRDIIKSDEYKDEADQYIQSVVKRRLGDGKAQQQLLDKSQQFIERVAYRYGIDGSDLSKLDFDALQSELDKDTAYLEDKALQNGVTVEVQQQLDRMQMQNRIYERQRAATQQEQDRREAFVQLAQQAEEFKQVIPGFDLAAEMEDPHFRQMVLPPNMRGSGLTIEQAYAATHYREMMGAGMQAASRQARESLSQSIRSGMSRPPENGSTSSRAADVRTDPSKFTTMDFKEIDRRVERGEKIRF